MQYTKHIFFKEILIFVVAAHCLGLLLLFYSERKDFEQEKFLIKTDTLGTTVVFMPLQKRVSAGQKKAQTDTLKKVRHIISHEAYEKAVARKNKVEKKQKKLSVKSNLTAAQSTKIEKKLAVNQAKGKEKNLTTLHQEKVKPVVEKKSVKTVPLQAKKAAEKIAAQKEKELALKKAIEKKAAAEKMERKKKELEKLLEKKKIVQAEVEKKKIADKKAAEKIVEDKVQEVKKMIVDEAIDITEEQAVQKIEKVAAIVPIVEESFENNEELLDQEDTIDLDNVSFVGRYDLEKYEIEEKIKKEIAQHWKSPIGMSKTATCELEITVGIDGKVLHVKIKKGSGSLAYDMSSKAAVYQCRFPKEVCGKEFTIVLGS